MRKVIKYINRHLSPHHQTGEHAVALRHEALLFYAAFLFLLQFGFHLVAVRFPGVLGFASSITVDEIISLTNRERVSQGLKELKVDQRLSQAAAEKAANMFAKNYWAHTAPDGTTPWFFIQRANYHYLYAGENLAKDFQNSLDVVEAWMASKAGHRENVLNGNYSDLGIAVVNGVLDGFETTLVVQLFGSERVAGLEVAAAPPTTPLKETVFKEEIKTPKSGKAEIVGEEKRPVSLEGPVSENQGVLLSPGSPAAPGPVVYSPVRTLFLPVVDVVALGKSVSYTFGFFLLGLFLIDSLTVARKRLIRLSGHSSAHLMILILLLATTWLISPGTIR